MEKPLRNIIVAMTGQRVIGQAGGIPWRIPEELRLFRDVTMGHTVLMGRRTFESIGGPLQGRQNIVVSRQLPDKPGIDVCRDLDSALKLADHYGKQLFFIGGVEIYRSALPLTDVMHVSWIKKEYAGDTYFPPFSTDEWRAISEKDYESFCYVVYRRLRETR